MNARTRLGLAAAAAVLVFVGAVLLRSRTVPAMTPSHCRQWQEASTCGDFQLAYTGYGPASAERLPEGWRVRLSPTAARTPDETHAGLVLHTDTVRDADITTTVRTIDQLRRPTPNPWETGWLLWHYIDDDHFYAVALKPNGWEISKEDPAYPGHQRFLATGSSPTFPVGRTYPIQVQVRGGTATVHLPGRTVRVVDAERPYLEGRTGLYTEDATVEFENTTVTAR